MNTDPTKETNGNLSVSLRELAESIRERCSGDGKAAMLVDGKFAGVLNEAADRLVSQDAETEDRLCCDERISLSSKES